MMDYWENDDDDVMMEGWNNGLKQLECLEMPGNAWNC